MSFAMTRLYVAVLLACMPKSVLIIPEDGLLGSPQLGQCCAENDGCLGPS